ncbi:MAG: hydroxylamine reductase [Candidatus Syntrophonatronum acetioxidans]|uniref:Hydroxylamine reductase n=1 Tax=Candidatus Syntrophonatronum acetioxidans TaxID=1795816 RepID=A0A424YGC6_9FIRM|nr:MAG: hydroxylamine reductase [Candidatus Syntrophonatronum acetioxidans]
MFCNQCEQTAKGVACTKKGVCGKSAEVAALQDLLIHTLKGLSLYAREGRKGGVVEEKVNRFTAEALFTTLTNVNFDAERFQEYINRSVEITRELKEKVKKAGGQVEFTQASASLEPAQDLEALIKQGEDMGQPWDQKAPEDIQSLQQTVLFGLKGVAAYAFHAALLGKEDDEIYAFIHEGLSALDSGNYSLDQWLEKVLKCGEINLKTMELLDAGHRESFGHPVPTEVPLGPKKGKCILVSGHDLKELKELLEETEGKGIYIYTHGEMLPAHGYPELKKHQHFYGHFGTAWQNQRQEFAEFPGPIVINTNCIQKPQESYQDHIFTTEVVGWPGAPHLENRDFSQVIDKALSMPGFKSDEDKGTVMVGFAHNSLLGVADKVVSAVKEGNIKHFFLVGGCDGSRKERNYYNEFVEKVPQDTLVLTLACGKFRFFNKKLGDIGGIPRLLDMGQCNDAYSAIKVAGALAEAFNCDVNELPLSMILSWFEQKAVAILLTLLHLGIKDIRLGPTLPAFVSPNVLSVLVDKFDIKPIATPEEDLATILK